MGLPEPSAEARAHSERVVAHVVKAIAEQGWISFADYMGAVLYAPGLGYYTAGARKFGAGGDFVTAPEMSPLFGRALATQVGQILDSVRDAEVIELGPGTGRLAGEMLSAEISNRSVSPLTVPERLNQPPPTFMLTAFPCWISTPVPANETRSDGQGRGWQDAVLLAQQRQQLGQGLLLVAAEDFGA